VNVGHDDLKSIHRSGRDLRQPVADGDGTGRAGRSQLHEADVRTDRVIMVEGEASLVDVEGLGAIDVSDRHSDQFEFEIHGSTLSAGSDSFGEQLPAAPMLLWKPGIMNGGPRIKALPKVLSWTVLVPVLAAVLLVFTWGRGIGVLVQVLVAFALAGAVLAAVNHAEIVAHRVGEPFGSLVLAVAVTIIEVGLIVTLMIAGGKGSESLARDTVFAAVMITCNGIVGLALLIGAVRFHLTIFNAEGSGAALATVATLATLSLVLPTFTSSRPGPEFTPAQLAFAAIASLVLYVIFVITQTVRHRDFFIPLTSAGEVVEAEDHADPPTAQRALLSVGMLVVALVAVVGLAKVETPAIEAGVAAVGFPPSFVGVVIALLVLLPESLAAARAANRDRIQISLNLAFGSAMASIGLTIPAIAVASIWLKGPLLLGLNATQMVLLAVTVVVASLTVVPGRATRLQGAVHLVLLAAFLFLAVVP
jgi:Ca2+:H+ antiporter